MKIECQAHSDLRSEVAPEGAKSADKVMLGVDCSMDMLPSATQRLERRCRRRYLRFGSLNMRIPICSHVLHLCADILALLRERVAYLPTLFCPPFETIYSRASACLVQHPSRVFQQLIPRVDGRAAVVCSKVRVRIRGNGCTLFREDRKS